MHGSQATWNYNWKKCENKNNQVSLFETVKKRPSQSAYRPTTFPATSLYFSRTSCQPADLTFQQSLLNNLLPQTRADNTHTHTPTVSSQRRLHWLDSGNLQRLKGRLLPPNSRYSLAYIHWLRFDTAVGHFNFCCSVTSYYLLRIW